VADRRTVDELSLEELEELLIIKRREARMQRLRQLAAQGRVAHVNPLALEQMPASAPGHPPPRQTGRRFSAVQLKPSDAAASFPTPAMSRGRRWRDRILLGIEILALAGLLFIFISTYDTLRTLNQEMVTARAAGQEMLAPTPTPLVYFERLPGGHTPPNQLGGTAPDVPLHLQQWVQPAPPQPLPTPSVGKPTRIVIPAIGVDAPIVEGVTWEDLKKGVGHLPGSAHPGQRGNMYLAAHNDIFGEIFRDLDKLELGDEFFVYSGNLQFRYKVTAKRIIEPTDVSVMLPSTRPIATLQTCYPYMVDTHRLVVIGELVE
jgi:sortase A